MENLALKSLRAGKNLTQKDMALLLGISTATYIAKENGNSNFTPTELAKLKQFFNLDLIEWYQIFFERQLNNNEIN